MRIAVFSITPLFPDHDMGGGQKHLRRIALYLAEQGHQLTLLCTRHPDHGAPFNWHENARVLPILRFRQPFPAPYDTPAYHIADIIQDVSQAARQADRLYIHDGEFVFPNVYRDVPTVVSLRDNVYPETIQGAFHFAAHRLVVISQYARDFFTSTVGRFYPELPDRMQVIRNSIDWGTFKPTPPGRLLDLLPGVDPARDLLVLHPHRPEPSKGLPQTIAVVDRLVHQHGLTQVKALVPLWLGLQHDAATRAFYDQMRAEISARGLDDHFVFHPWIPVDLMPAYFSLGAVTLALGSFVESFGNSVYESLGCGTPTIVARISSHRELLPETLIDKVDFDDHDTAAALAAGILRERRRTSPETLAYLRQHFRVSEQLQAYADAILGAQVAEPMRYVYLPLDETTRYRLAPWCYIASGERGIYHDYRVGYERDPALIRLVSGFPNGFTQADAAGLNLSADQIDGWRRDGYLSPVMPGAD